jgi:hypothetical protein
MLIEIFYATYGRDEDGLYDGNLENQFVFRWLYCMDKDFVTCIHEKEPIALLILAYYGFLLGTVEEGWYICSWRDHLIKNIRRFIPDECQRWLRWPTEMLGSVKDERGGI